MLKWSWGKIGKEWNSNAYYCQVNISESPQSTLNNYIVSNGNIFPNLAPITNMSFGRVQQVDRNGPMAGSFPLGSIINAPPTRQESHYSCRWLGIPTPPGSYPGEGAPGSCPAHPLTLFSLTCQDHEFSGLFSLLASPLGIHFSFCRQQSNVPGNCFKCLCSTWDHFNTFADGLEHYFFSKWAVNSKSFLPYFCTDI